MNAKNTGGKSSPLSLGKLSQVSQLVVRKPDGDVDLSLIYTERQVRTDLGDLEGLVASIKELGVQQPIIVMEMPDGRFLLIAGERRFRASLRADKAKIPAIIKRDLSPKQIRQIQVTENNDREALSAYDEAMGVAEDIETFGLQEALLIWNRSDAWMSKRKAVAKYAEPVKALLREGHTKDLEILHSLNAGISSYPDRFEVIAAQLRAGEMVTRAEARQLAADAKESRASNPSKGKTTDSAPPGAKGKSRDEPPSVKGRSSTADSESSGGPRGLSFQTDSSFDPKLPAESDKDRLVAGLLRDREDIVHAGESIAQRFNALQTSMKGVGYAQQEGEWVLWSGVLDVILPILASLGKDRAAAYLARLQGELAERDALSLWQAMHPTDAEDVGIAPMPADWKGWQA